MSDERKQVVGFFDGREVVRQKSAGGYRYVGLLDDKWDLFYEHDPYDRHAFSALSVDLGMLPLDEGKKSRVLAKALEWNHYCVRRHPFGLVFREKGQRAVLLRMIGPGDVDEQTAQQQFSSFLNFARQAAQVLKEAKQGRAAAGLFL